MNIREKIIQLRKMVPENGATEAEAMVALELAAKLMAKHGITEDELNKAEFERDMSRNGFDKENKNRDLPSTSAVEPSLISAKWNSGGPTR
jgi:hypothetical protein